MTKHPEQMFDVREIDEAQYYVRECDSLIDVTKEHIGYAIDLALEVAQGKAFVCRVEELGLSIPEEATTLIDAEGVHTIDFGKYSTMLDTPSGDYIGEPYGKLTFNGKPTIPTIEDK